MIHCFQKISFFRFIQKITLVIIFIFILILFFYPFLSLALGNIFFGGISQVYNVRLAQLLFKHAAYPILPVQPPRYAHHQLSRTYFIQGKLNDAFEEINKELVIYPNNIKAYYILGLTNGYMDRTYEAIDAFSRYIEANPETWAGRNDKAWLQFRIGDIDGALETIQPIIKQYPETPWVQNTYCALLINKPDRHEEAMTVCTLAKDLSDRMTPQDWGYAYPGNDPRIYREGLQAMKDSATKNLRIINGKKP
jgi:tetratricopeptide (TPR) repeat protein